MPPPVTSTSLILTEPRPSLPVLMASVPEVVWPMPGVEPSVRPDSFTWPLPLCASGLLGTTSTVGVESASSVMVTVASLSSPSASVIVYLKVTTPSSPAAGV